MSMLKAYVINLDSRTDRWNDVIRQRVIDGIQIERVSAIPFDELNSEALTYAAPGVAATWLSHRKAAKLLLDSVDEFALILEDDFIFQRGFDCPDINELKMQGIDFVQFGFLKVSRWESLDILVSNLKDRFVRLLVMMIKKSIPGFTKFGSKTLVREVYELSSQFVPADIRPGGHCYLISRKMAEAIQVLNNPVIFSADELYISISKMRAFKMVRLRTSTVKQSDSQSSVSQRFKQY